MNEAYKCTYGNGATYIHNMYINMYGQFPVVPFGQQDRRLRTVHRAHRPHMVTSLTPNKITIGPSNPGEQFYTKPAGLLSNASTSKASDHPTVKVVY